MMPPRTRPGVEVARERGGLVGAPHKGHADAPRSISARQFGHMRCDESYDCSLEPSAESQLVFNLCSLNHNFGDKAIPRQYEGFSLKCEGQTARDMWPRVTGFIICSLSMDRSSDTIRRKWPERRSAPLLAHQDQNLRLLLPLSQVRMACHPE